MRSKGNYFKLEMIDYIRSDSVKDCLKCCPERFATFLFILEHLGTIDTKNCDVYEKITCLKSLNLSSLDLPRSTSNKKLQKLSTDDAQKLCSFLNH